MRIVKNILIGFGVLFVAVIGLHITPAGDAPVAHLKHEA